jgi:hypothetical protein
MNEIKSNWIKAYIVDVLPCITVAIYILAFIYNIAFFSVFNINITHFLSFSEMLLSIIDTLVAFAFLSLLAIWFSLFHITYFTPWDEQMEKRKRNAQHNKKLFKLPFRYLRIIVSVKKSKFCTSISHFIKKMEEKEEASRIRNEKRREELEKNENYHSWGSFFSTLFVMLLSYWLFNAMRENGNLDKGIMGASIGLFIPVCISAALPFAFYVGSIFDFSKKKKKFNIKHFKPIELLEIILVYYIYAIIIFYISGIDSGNYYKNNDLVKFEIKASDGTCFSDSTYRYINYSNEKIFLLEKETSDNIIIDREGITYIKINYGDKSSNSIIVRLLNKGSGVNTKKEQAL